MPENRYLIVPTYLHPKLGNQLERTLLLLQERAYGLISVVRVTTSYRSAGLSSLEDAGKAPRVFLGCSDGIATRPPLCLLLTPERPVSDD